MFGFQVWLFLVLLVLVTPEDDPCHPDHHDTIDEDWRSPSYTAPSGSEYCDATIREGWYRHLGGNMPTTAPNMNRCGTSYPIWMNGNLPTSTVTTDVKVCIKTIFSDCSFHWNIRVKKCDQFYVYYLKQATLCSSAYCFGSAVVCSECGEAPNVTLVAEVTPGLYTTSFNYLGTPVVLKGIVFLCNLRCDNNSDLKDYLYDVQWFINDNTITIHRNIRYANLTQAGLNQVEWSGKYVPGFQVKCAARARSEIDSTPTPYSYSDGFYAGFKTDEPTYSLPEDGETDINITLTIPIDCLYPENATPAEISVFVEEVCKVDIRMRVPTYYDENGNLACTLGGVTDEPVSFVNNLCVLTFKSNEWNKTKTISVYGSADGIISTDNSRTSHIRFKADVNVHSPAWSGATTSDIKLYVFDEDPKISGKTCCIQTDPHITTFDKRHILFNQSGEFIVFKHKFLPVRIHVILDWCWQPWRGACMCGVAIRYHNAVYVLNLCKEDIGSKWLKSSKVNRYAELRACDDSLMQVEFKNGKFTVTLPYGTTIELGLHIGKLNIHINMFILRPTLVDWRATSGMCGFLDGVPDNDITDRDGKEVRGFGLIWRHNKTKDGPSLFTNDTLDDIAIPPLQYCKCMTNGNFSHNPEVQCNLDSSITKCQKHTNIDGYFGQCETNREKRETHGYSNIHKRYVESDDDFEVPRYDPNFDEAYDFHPEETITWINGWNQSLAEEACRNTMDNDPMVSKCKDAVFAMNDFTANGIQECIGDIMLSGHDGHREDTLKAIQKNCLVQAVLYENLTSKGSNGSESTIFDELLELSCPENCSGKGICKNGKCDCQAGFYGDSCARELGTAPEILTDGVTCSIDKRSCKNFVISGNNFLDVSLTCRVRLLKIYATRWEIGASIIFSARYLNDFNCVCSIPDSHRRRRSADDSDEIFAEGYLVSVSNDGNNFSNETTIIAFDSGCYDCDAIYMNCTKLGESCDQTIATEPTIAEDDALPLAVIIVCVLVTAIGIAVAFTLIKAKLFSTKSRVNQDRPTTSQTLSVIDLEDDSNRMTTAWEKEKCSSKQTLHSNKIDKDTQHPFTPSLSVIGLAKDSNQMTAEREKTKWSREQTFRKEKDTQRPNTASVSVIDLEFNTE